MVGKCDWTNQTVGKHWITCLDLKTGCMKKPVRWKNKQKSFVSLNTQYSINTLSCKRNRDLNRNLTGRCLVQRRLRARRCSSSLAEVMPRWPESGIGNAAGRSSPGEAAAADISSFCTAPPHCCILGTVEEQKTGYEAVSFIAVITFIILTTRSLDTVCCSYFTSCSCYCRKGGC